MSVFKTSSLMTVLILTMGLAACGTTGYYNPATGTSVAVVEGPAACTPGETRNGQTCTCNYRQSISGQGAFTNCAFRAVGVAPQTPWRDCFLNLNAPYHKDCLDQGSASYYNQGGYQRPGSPFYTSSPAPGYRAKYHCTGRPGDQNCDRMPAR